MRKAILEFDFGNTRVKWRLWSDQRVSAYGAVGYQENIFNAIEPHIATDSAVDLIRFSSVVAEQKYNPVLHQCVDWCRDAPVQAKVQSPFAGLRAAYGNLNNLGVDRWLAMLAAFHQISGPVVVVGCGTAVTVDLIAAGGDHLGGYIVPGLDLMREALFQRTHSVQLSHMEAPKDLHPGTDTAPAVVRGVFLMLAALINTSCQILRERENAEAGIEESGVKIVMTGGDAPTISPFVDGNPVYNEHLVLDGLGIAVP